MSITSQSALRIRKQSSIATYDLEDSAYKMRLVECPLMFPTEAKDAATIDYPDENGVDSYENNETYMQPFDATFQLAFVAASPTASHTAIKWLLNYCTHNGSLHEIYSPWSGVARQRCRFKKLDNISQHRNSDNEYVVEFSITFSVEDPMTEIETF